MWRSSVRLETRCSARWAERALRSWCTASGLPDRPYAKLQPLGQSLCIEIQRRAYWSNSGRFTSPGNRFLLVPCQSFMLEFQGGILVATLRLSYH
ncbi:hypothetical protein H8959_009308 [Pygathrix nigripes]